MLSMLPAVSAEKNRAPRPWVAALLAAATAFAPGLVRAETGAPLPPGYTSDASAAPVQQVDAADEDPSDGYSDTDPSALTDFREPLSPYGAWVADPTYGTVWVPDATVVGADFAPYQTSGHWALTDDEQWLWVSDYDWGYIPFHYGRWIWINGRGWSWIPGRVYSSAWVSWRVGDAGYIGWAPMPPAWYWAGGVAVNLWMTPYAAYCFVPTTHVFHQHVHTYVVRDAATVRSVAASTRTYKPAHPTIKGSGGGAGGGGSHFRIASPSMKEAGVPSSAAPKAHVSPDMRSKAFASRSSTAAVRQAVAAGHGFRAGSFPISSLPPRRSGPVSAGSLGRGPGSAGSAGGGSGSAGSPSMPPVSRDVRTNGPVLRTPRDAVHTGSPAQRSAPTFSGRPVERSAPTSTLRPTPRPSFSSPSLPASPSSGFRTPSSSVSSGSRAPSSSVSSGSRAPSSSVSSGSRAPSTVSAPSRPSAPSHSSSSSKSTSSPPSSSHSSGGSHTSGGHSGRR
jgi:hypothetical protein